MNAFLCTIWRSNQAISLISSFFGSLFFAILAYLVFHVFPTDISRLYVICMLASAIAFIPKESLYQTSLVYISKSKSIQSSEFSSKTASYCDFKQLIFLISFAICIVSAPLYVFFLHISSVDHSKIFLFAPLPISVFFASSIQQISLYYRIIIYASRSFRALTIVELTQPFISILGCMLVKQLDLFPCNEKSLGLILIISTISAEVLTILLVYILRLKELYNSQAKLPSYLLKSFISFFLSKTVGLSVFNIRANLVPLLLASSYGSSVAVASAYIIRFVGIGLVISSSYVKVLLPNLLSSSSDLSISNSVRFAKINVFIFLAVSTLFAPFAKEIIFMLLGFSPPEVYILLAYCILLNIPEMLISGVKVWNARSQNNRSYEAGNFFIQVIGIVVFWVFVFNDFNLAASLSVLIFGSFLSCFWRTLCTLNFNVNLSLSLFASIMRSIVFSMIVPALILLATSNLDPPIQLMGKILFQIISIAFLSYRLLGTNPFNSLKFIKSTSRCIESH